ncbi:MAG: ABC transporter ATP-binding protein [Burkholderiales bacterium]|jgi:branched-chain amino acid transport system ATP-binding protein|nr:ABC transporter ATP-binding protein [Burkholderiales bacterium]
MNTAIPSNAPVLLQVDKLVKRYGGLVATDHAQLNVVQGSIHALIGPNGAGKTTLIHQISGALQPDEGTLRFDGHDVTAMPMHERVHRGLVRSYQITNIFKRLSVLDNIALAVQARSGSSLRFWHAARAEKARYDEAAVLAERCGLGKRTHAIAGSLSHGEQRQLELGLALAANPKLLLLDEPMAGMGSDDSEKMVELMLGLRGAFTILLIEHDMDAVFRLADTISTLVFGRVIATGTPDQIKNHPDVRAAYLGDDA